jgi:hypothetical protein
MQSVPVHFYKSSCKSYSYVSDHEILENMCMNYAMKYGYF